VVCGLNLGWLLHPVKRGWHMLNNNTRSIQRTGALNMSTDTSNSKLAQIYIQAKTNITFFIVVHWGWHRCRCQNIYQYCLSQPTYNNFIRWQLVLTLDLDHHHEEFEHILKQNHNLDISLFSIRSTFKMYVECTKVKFI
jgi:hypothetical protein